MASAIYLDTCGELVDQTADRAFHRVVLAFMMMSAGQVARMGAAGAGAGEWPDRCGAIAGRAARRPDRGTATCWAAATVPLPALKRPPTGFARPQPLACGPAGSSAQARTAMAPRRSTRIEALDPFDPLSSTTS